MKLRSQTDRSHAPCASAPIFAERGNSQDDRPPISDESYDRIPDKFKFPEQKDARRNEPPRRPIPPRFDGEPPRTTLPRILFLSAVFVALYIGYHAFFTPKSSEITWTAFNRALDEGLLESGEISGTTISGNFRRIPSLAEWIELVPNGRKQFENAVVQFNRTRASLAEEYEKQLFDEMQDCALVEVRPAQEGAEGDGSAEGTVTLRLKLANGAVVKEQQVSADMPPQEREAAGMAMKQLWVLERQVEQRWVLREIGQGWSGVRDALQMVDAQNGKPFGKIFFKRYSCETPPFAFNDQTLDRRLREKLDSYASSPATDGSLWLTCLSIVATIVFFVFIFRMMKNTREQFMGGGFGFIRSLAKKYDPNSAKRVTFDDVAGMDQVKAELVEVVDYLKNPAKYERMGARVPKGTLLFGPPGTGKTLLARAVAGEANVPFFSVNGSEFIQMFVGVGASRVREIFDAAKENAPSILFIDEIDAVGRQRGAGFGGGQDEREQTLNQILSEMDGFTQSESVMVMASTNRPDVLDPALMRPGRFDRHITVGRPSMKGRVDIFKVYLRKIPYGSDVDVDKLAKQTAGFTGADIRNFVNEATLFATRSNKTRVEAADFDYAFEKIALGLKRDEIISEENKRKTAVHESGHAVVGWFMPNGSTVHKVTIIPRGRALGVTWSLPDEDRVSYDFNDAFASLAHLLAGRAAEKLVCGVTTSGVENDLQRATELARDMVSRWGMSDRLGPLSYPNSETQPFLGRDVATETRNYSEATAQIIDEETKRVVDEADAAARALIEEHRAKFDALVDALVEDEEVDYARLRELLGPRPGEESAPNAADAETAETASTSETDPQGTGGESISVRNSDEYGL